MVIWSSGQRPIDQNWSNGPFDDRIFSDNQLSCCKNVKIVLKIGSRPTFRMHW